MLREASGRIKEAEEVIQLLLTDERLKLMNGMFEASQRVMKAELAYQHARAARSALSELKKMIQ